ncbi:MAG: hypothetical protein ABIF87_13205 [Pseudomonadota bacterium]
MDSIGKINKTIMACPECHHEIDVAIETDADGFFVCPICSQKIKFSKEAKAASDPSKSSAMSQNSGTNDVQDRHLNGFDEELFLCGVIGVSIGTFAPSISLWQTFVGAFLTTLFGVILKSRHYKRYVCICTRLGIEESRSLYWLLTMFKNGLFILIFLTIVSWFNCDLFEASF